MLALIKWLAARAALILLICIVVLQFLTWRAVSDIYVPRAPESCGLRSTCQVELSAYSVDALATALAKKLGR
ncbi:MAG: hypothetical protein LC750_00375 [Actinobacteria bacterium]|nr:hypothetical protein [Actinomycetota bacterium]